MSRFINERYKGLEGYTPGEQPDADRFIKLNTNESPFPPAPCVENALSGIDTGKLRLYPDPSCASLKERLSERYGVSPDEVMVTNGSDDVLGYFFMAYGESAPAAFPDITYSFYKVLAELHGVLYEEIPLDGDLTISPDDYIGIEKNVVIANPNAPTGLMLSQGEIEEIVKSNPDNMVLIDEAYVDFGAESCIPLIHKYDNLLVVQTYSKSRSFAGGRVGFAFGDREVIEDLEKIRFSMSPYSVDRISQVLAEAALDDEDYYLENIEEIKKNRRYTRLALSDLGFKVVPSMANFIFVRHHSIKGADLYNELKDSGILVRHFDQERIREYNRITIGARDEMDELVRVIREILEERSII